MKNVLYIIPMIVVVVAVDFLFLKHHFKARLITNIVIVIVFAAFYFVFLKRR